MKRKKGYRSVALVLVLFMVITAVMMQTECEVYAATPVSSHGRLSVKGADLIDKNKKKFQLRGISTHGINWDVGSPYVNKAAFKTLRNDWGANAVRLAMYTSEYNGYCSGGSKSALRNQIYKGVQYATDLGMYVIIDWHILNDGNPKSHLKEAKSFFKTMAKKYKKQKNVIYEICNEPNGCSWKTIKSYATSVIRTIRKYDKNAIIVVGTPTWSPVMVTEFGMSAASGGGGISKSSTGKWLRRLNKSNISYFCWSLSNKNESCSLLSSRTRKTSGWKTSDLSAAGKYIRSKYRARRRS